MNSKVKIVGVSDASLGYGSPQIPMFMQSLAIYYGTKSMIIEPDTPGKPPLHDLYPDLLIKRMYTGIHPYSTAGRIRYIMAAAKEINKLRPDILVIFCTYSFPVLFKIKYRPRFVIYYAIELISMYGSFDIMMNRYGAPFVDLVIFPEENRAAIDIERCSLHNLPIVIVYNSAATLSQANYIVHPRQRNGRIISAGTIGAELTFAEYFLHEKMQSMPIDVYGPFEGIKKKELAEAFHSLIGNVRYCGYVDLQYLARIRRHYSFSIVIWNPAVERGLYAPSNKFFEAISDGVPPITAPHPQHKMFVQRYKCGIVMKDWSFDSFYEAIQHALKIYGTEEYDAMVENCRRAFLEELNWEKQFEKVKPFLKEVR